MCCFWYMCIYQYVTHATRTTSYCWMFFMENIMFVYFYVSKKKKITVTYLYTGRCMKMCCHITTIIDQKQKPYIFFIVYTYVYVCIWRIQKIWPELFTFANLCAYKWIFIIIKQLPALLIIFFAVELLYLMRCILCEFRCPTDNSSCRSWMKLLNKNIFWVFIFFRRNWGYLFKKIRVKMTHRFFADFFN